MKKYILMSLLSAGIVMSNAGYAVPAPAAMHYGLPTKHLNNALIAAAYAAQPLVIHNCTSYPYQVYVQQYQGEMQGPMMIYPVGNYPQNYISIDNPTWEVYVEVDDNIYPYPAHKIFTGVINITAPNVDIGYCNVASGSHSAMMNNSATSVKVEVH